MLKTRLGHLFDRMGGRMLGALYCLIISISVVIGCRIGAGYGIAALFAFIGLIGIWDELGGRK